jgi:hypothetical protein
MNHRVRFVLDCAKLVGYDSIDTFIVDYDATVLENPARMLEQKLPYRDQDSQPRHAILHTNSTIVPTRKIQHCEDGVLKFAESILSAECRHFSQSSAIEGELEQPRGLDQRIEALATDGSIETHETFLKPISTAVRNALEDEVCMQPTLHPESGCLLGSSYQTCGHSSWPYPRKI